MSGDVYVSKVKQDHTLGDKLGIRVKYRGEEWQPAQFEIPVEPKHVQETVQKASRGFRLAADEFPEGVAVWNERAFAKARDILWAGPFLTVKAKIAEVLSRFDLGEGGLVPVPLYKADLKTPWSEPYYYINWSEPKDTFLPEESSRLELLATKPDTGERFWCLNSPSDREVALSPTATSGADIWIEKYVFRDIFLSGALVDALLRAKIDVDLRLAKCRIVEG